MTTAMLLPLMRSGCMRGEADDRCVLDDATGQPNLTRREEGGGGAMARKEVTQQSKNGGGKRDYGKRRGRGNWVGRGESQSSRGALCPRVYLQEILEPSQNYTCANWLFPDPTYQLHCPIFSYRPFFGIHMEDLRQMQIK
jgi:hypothetical protein